MEEKDMSMPSGTFHVIFSVQATGWFVKKKGSLRGALLRGGSHHFAYACSGYYHKKSVPARDVDEPSGYCGKSITAVCQICKKKDYLVWGSLFLGELDCKLEPTNPMYALLGEHSDTNNFRARKVADILSRAIVGCQLLGVIPSTIRPL